MTPEREHRIREVSGRRQLDVAVVLENVHDPHNIAAVVRTCDAEAEIRSEFKVYMRYTGQGWEIPIELSEAQAMQPDAATFLERFEEDYIRLFGRTVAGMDVEITVWAVNATTPAEEVARVATKLGTENAIPSGSAIVLTCSRWV